MIDRTGQNLVFLLSTPRAGSTLVSAILANHSQACCPNEPWFLLGLAAWRQGGNLTYAPYEHLGVETALKEFLSDEEYREAARAFAVQAYNSRLAAHGKTVFVDKTPRYYHILPFIEPLFPAARKVWLKRNPLDVVASYQTSWQLSVDQLFDPRFGPMCLDLTLGLARFAAFFQGQPNAFEFRYEDLVRSPASVLQALCAFLGLAYEPGMEDYGAHPQALEERRRKRMGDTSVFEHARPHAQSLNRWQTILTEAQIQQVLDCIGARFFERMDYGDTVRQLREKGFRFPDEAAVADNLRAFEESARTLPWAHRERDQFKAQAEELRADRDRLQALCEELRAERDRFKDECDRLKSRSETTPTPPSPETAGGGVTAPGSLARWWNWRRGAGKK